MHKAHMRDHASSGTGDWRLATGDQPLRWTTCLILLAAPWLLTTALLAQPHHASRVPLAFDRFYDYEEIVEALRALTAAYPELLTLESIGKSTEERDRVKVFFCLAMARPFDGLPARGAGAGCQ